MNPYQDSYTLSLCEQFYSNYYNDSEPRTLVLGINPGRFGSGTTGISFTDPVVLQEACGIKNDLLKKTELSASFIYQMIDVYGGPEKFYRNFFVSAVSPLGFTKNGKNINYYDDIKLQKAVSPFIVASINGLLKLNINRTKCFCIGEGKNFDFLMNLNQKYHWFETIVPLAHPRFIMQYKRKQLTSYIQHYIQALTD